MVTVRSSEFEVCVAKESLGQPVSIVLTDSQGNEIIHSEGTRGIFDHVSCYSNCHKNYALLIFL